jgi:hypothetical protein
MLKISKSIMQQYIRTGKSYKEAFNTISHLGQEGTEILKTFWSLSEPLNQQHCTFKGQKDMIDLVKDKTVELYDVANPYLPISFEDSQVDYLIYEGYATHEYDPTFIPFVAGLGSTYAADLPAVEFHEDELWIAESLNTTPGYEFMIV